jgi:AmmeMemoRadiSam system protein A
MADRETLRAEDRAVLLAAAREAIRCALEGRPHERPRGSATLEAPGGAFVTLWLDGDLRGCIGTLDAARPLIDSVLDAAVSAATRDRRFNRLTLAELDRVVLDISVLGDFEKVEDPNEIVVGRDGLLLRVGVMSGIFLPQVATEQGWDRETYLDHLAMKAGLPRAAWRRPDARIERFTAEVFGEE